MPPCSGPHLFLPSSTGAAEGADHSSPSLESGVRSQGHILSSCHKQPVEVCLGDRKFPGLWQESASPNTSNQRPLWMCSEKHQQAPLYISNFRAMQGNLQTENRIKFMAEETRAGYPAESCTQLGKSSSVSQRFHRDQSRSSQELLLVPSAALSRQN